MTGKKAMQFQSTKKTKTLIKSYIPISVLPIFKKTFEIFIFNSLFNYFIQNKLFADCQFGFIRGDPCVVQLLSITHEIQKRFGCNPPFDIRGTSLDISKAFCKVRYECLIFKLKPYGVDGSLLKLMENFLIGRQQKVVLNVQSSSWKIQRLEYHRGLCLDLFYFQFILMIYLIRIESICKVFVYYTLLFSKVKDETFSDT